jgi:hypothetical protein
MVCHPEGARLLRDCGFGRGGQGGCWPGWGDAGWLGTREAGERASLRECRLVGLGHGGNGGIVGDFLGHFGPAKVEMDVGRISYGDVESAQDELGAAEVDAVADEGVDEFHERGLNAFLAFNEGDGVNARLGRGADAADHALMEVTENFAAEGGGAARDSVDLDVSADADVLIGWHGFYTFRSFRGLVVGGLIRIEKFSRSRF